MNQEEKWREEFERFISERNEECSNVYSLERCGDPMYSHEYVDGELWFAFECYHFARKKAQKEIYKEFEKNKILAKEVAYKWSEVANLKEELEKRDRLLDDWLEKVNKIKDKEAK